MKREDQILIDLLADFVNGQSPGALPEVSLGALYQTACKHNVTGIVAELLHPFLENAEEPAVRKLQESHMATVFRSVLLEEEVKLFSARMVMDLALFLKVYQDTLDRDYIRAQLELLQMDRFVKTVLYASGEWFGIPANIDPAGVLFDPTEGAVEDRISEEKAYGLFYSGAGAVSGAPAGGLDKSVAARAAEPLEDEGGVQGDRSE